MAMISMEHWTLIAVACGVIAVVKYADFIRQRTLRRTDTGTYVWIEWHGGTRSSARDPRDPGGAWDSDGDGCGDGDD